MRRPGVGAARRSGFRGIGGAVLIAPANTVAPVISSDGSVIGVGETLTGTNGTWTGTPAPSFTYQWQRGATFGAGGGSFSDIGGATANPRAIVSADVGFSIRLAVTATNAAGSATAYSNALLYLHATDLPNTAIWVSQSGVTTADAGTTCDVWASAYGGRSATLTAVAGSQRPAYSATGGVGSRPLITTDGTDDVMKGAITTGAAFNGTTGCTMAVLGARVAFAAAGDVWLEYEDDTTGGMFYAIRDVSSSVWRGTDTSVADLNATSDPDGVNALYQFDLATNAWAVRKNGTSEATSASAVTARNDSEVIALGGRTAASAYAQIAVQGIVFGKLLSTAQRANVRAFLTNASGISV